MRVNNTEADEQPSITPPAVIELAEDVAEIMARMLAGKAVYWFERMKVRDAVNGQLGD